MSKVTINGNTYSGNNIIVAKGRVIIDGVSMTPNEKTINISVDGNIETLQVDACNQVTINGSCAPVRSGSGDIECGNVEGPLTTGSGDIECGNVHGSVNSGSGDIKAHLIAGNASTMSGDIKEKDGDKKFFNFVMKNAPELLKQFEAHQA